MAVRLKRLLLVILLAALLGTGWSALRGRPGCQAAPPPTDPRVNAEQPAEEADAPMIDPMSANAACYVCHMTFIHEDLSKTHLKEKVNCISCHGLSAKHANDEDVGASKPDKMFKGAAVDKMCAECHEEHDAPARKVVARFLERKLTTADSHCTACHGTHKIEHAAEEEQ